RLLSSYVNPGMETLGCMLPYMQLDSDRFERLDTHALVMTSRNISECPITITPEEAEKQLAGKIPLMLHNNRVYDSVIQVFGGQTCLIRR
ncbi:Sua5/YciO/YrdC/YwlC family protein, partial [Parabacteroides merdae]|uniref:Sua5/YciO/YrdC/YwlC family protein n=1 Tax=Parabacteroides merdae TaxID=46503 RepID=UPI00210EB7EE